MFAPTVMCDAMMLMCRPQVVHDHEACAQPAAPPADSNGAGHAPCNSHAAGSRSASPDYKPSLEAPPRLSFYLDGAHTEESMATCADWFADAVAEQSRDVSAGCHSGSISAMHGRAGAAGGGAGGGAECPEVQRVLLFNCMPVRTCQTGCNS